MNTCVKFHDSTISSFRGVARRTTFCNNVLIHVIENSKWRPSCFSDHYEFHLGPTRDQDEYTVCGKFRDNTYSGFR